MHKRQARLARDGGRSERALHCYRPLLAPALSDISHPAGMGESVVGRHPRDAVERDEPVAAVNGEDDGEEGGRKKRGGRPVGRRRRGRHSRRKIKRWKLPRRRRLRRRRG